MAPGAEENWTVSVEHSEADVQHFVNNFEAMARELRA
jgi:glutamate-1-semialdehyde aminotransferase